MEKLLLREYNELSLGGEQVKRNEYGNIVIPNVLLQRANARNKNGRIYSRSLLDRELNRYMSSIKERNALGELDHVDESIVNLQKASHLVTEAHWNNDEIRGTIEILAATAQGKNLDGLISSRVKVGISSRGVGTVQEVGGQTLVNDDFILICWDVVSDPSTHGAYLLEGTSVVKKVMSKDEQIKKIVEEYFGK